MRLSTSYMYQRQIDNMSKAMSNYDNVSIRLSAGQSLLRPSDDPCAASQAVICQSSLADLGQFDTARTYAQDALGQTDSTLTSISGLLNKNLAEKIIAGGNGSYSDADRQALATELKGVRDNLLNLANTKNSDGRYIFAGYKTGSVPFKSVSIPGGVPHIDYVGGTTPMNQHVADSTDMDVGVTGNDIFMSGSPDDLFGQLDKAIAALNTPVTSQADRDALKNTLDSVNVSLHKGIDNLGKIQAKVGTNLQQLETLGAKSDTQSIQLQSRLQQTVGSDPNTFITLVSQSKMSEFALNSSMTVFQAMQQLSIFKMVG